VRPLDLHPRRTPPTTALDTVLTSSTVLLYCRHTSTTKTSTIRSLHNPPAILFASFGALDIVCSDRSYPSAIPNCAPSNSARSSPQGHLATPPNPYKRFSRGARRLAIFALSSLAPSTHWRKTLLRPAFRWLIRSPNAIHTSHIT